MIEKKKRPTKKVVSHIDKCLSCYSCMTTCPSGVNYMHLIDHGRNYVEENIRDLFHKEYLEIFYLKHYQTKNFQIFNFYFLYRKIFKFLIPGTLGSMLDLAPKKIYKKTLKFQNVYKAEKQQGLHY